MAKQFNNNNVKVALTNLGKYTEGELSFVWLDLPATDEEIEAAYEAIGIDGVEYEEYFITDYEAPFEIGEYDNLTMLNELAEEFDGLDEYEMMAVRAYMNEVHGDVEDALHVAQSGDYVVYNDVDDMADVVHDMIHVHGLFEIDEDNPLLRYIDYEKFGRDLDIEGTFVFIDGDCIEFYG